jgi:ribonucleoside-diphosphate reductase alpha chain
MINVIKRSGAKEPLDIDKIHRCVEWACEGLTGVSVSELELNAQIQFYNNIKTNDIQETLIKAASELITEDNPNYQFVAGRLINYHLRKMVYNQFEPIDLLTHVKNVTELGYYDKNILEMYSEEEFALLNDYIDHDRDNLIAYAGMEQLRGKYLVKNRLTGITYETPQMAFMLISMTLFINYKTDRLKWVKELYDALSTFDVSLPTPIMAGVRTPERQFSSCTLIETDDTLDSIIATTGAIVKYVSQKAGIGVGAGRIRLTGSIVRGGRVVHTGNTGYYKLFQSAVGSCSQGGVRPGAATVYYPLWHGEIENLLVLKNNKGIETNRVRHMDYGVQFSKLMYDRLISGGNITLFNPHEVQDLYEAFYADESRFKFLYEQYEKSNKVWKKTIPAVELFNSFIQERKDTGRVYYMNVDHCNSHGSFIPEIAPIRMSNLCSEITLHTKPLKSLDDPDGEIALCILAAQNMGKIKKSEDFERGAILLVRALDALIDYQEYPVLAAKNSTMKRRPLGIGLINLAYWLAKNNQTYTNCDLDMFDEYMEAWSYYLIKASADLAVEFGPCPAWKDTKYSQGILPIHTYKKAVDELTSRAPKYDWEALARQIQETGIRNSTLMAQMPAETSAQVSNGTNGINAPRALVSIKKSRDGVLKQVVPGIAKLKNKYELLWDQKSNKGHFNIAAIMTKWMDQAISIDASYNPKHFADNKIPTSVLLGDLLYAYKYGHKTGYYLNTNDQSGEEEEQLDDAVHEEEDCDGCKL